MGGRGSSSSLGKSRYKIGEPMSDKHIVFPAHAGVILAQLAKL